MAFFRKEADHVFKARFQQQQPASGDLLTPSTGVVFMARQNHRTVTVQLANTRVFVVCAAVGNVLRLSWQDPFEKASKTEEVPEHRVPEKLSPLPTFQRPTLQQLAAQRKDANRPQIVLLALRELCRLHATGSSRSPLISGCNQNNFAQQATYPGHDLAVTLHTRVPFRNPLVSGNEQEYFLVGSVMASDCSEIRYMGNSLRLTSVSQAGAVKSGPPQLTKTAKPPFR